MKLNVSTFKNTGGNKIADILNTSEVIALKRCNHLAGVLQVALTFIKPREHFV